MAGLACLCPLGNRKSIGFRNLLLTVLVGSATTVVHGWSGPAPLRSLSSAPHFVSHDKLDGGSARRCCLAGSGFLSTRTHVLSLKMQASRAETVLDKGEIWLRKQTIGTLLEKAEVRSLLDELKTDDAYWKSQRPTYDRIFDAVEGRLRAEDRPLKEILREDLYSKILKAVQEADLDPDVVKAFMRTPAFESLAGAILYTGIFEFVQRADILGNIVNQLPVIGPIRQEINKALKDTLDQTLGGQIKDFLGTQSRPAVEQMIQFILSDDNKKSFGNSGKRLADFILSRPVQSLMPGEESMQTIRDEGFEAFREIFGTIAEQDDLFDSFFERFGDEEVGTFLPELTPTAKKGMLKVWQRFLDSEASGLDLTESGGKRPPRERDLE